MLSIVRITYERREVVMCYLCVIENPFEVKPPPSNLEQKMARAKKIKESLKSSSNTQKCSVGEQLEDILRQEQYELSREL